MENRVTFRSGDITADPADLLVNTVNTVSVMGKGVALAFKTRWPSIMKDYRSACESRRLLAGGCMLFPLPDGRQWAALATKAHWRDPSRYEWVETGLIELARLAANASLRSIAIPPPGCGNGGLDWRKVRPMVLATLSEFDLRIYGTPD
jgi:O-acetyl-ADP-ribose deacetylase (regulator of RNase III)